MGGQACNIQLNDTPWSKSLRTDEPILLSPVRLSLYVILMTCMTCRGYGGSIQTSFDMGTPCSGQLDLQVLIINL
jgi:hypothetical protein